MTTTPTNRRPSGEFLQSVRDVLTAHPRSAFTATEVTKALGTTNSGATGNALRRLVAKGEAVQVQDKPRRWRKAAAKAASAA